MLAHDQRVMFSSGKDDWETPPALFAELSDEFKFALDVAANIHNRKVPCYLGPDNYDFELRDALSADWADVLRHIGLGATCWCNPPYSRGLQAAFIHKAAVEMLRGVTTVMLIPARTDTRAFHACIWNCGQHEPYIGIEVWFLKGRLKFVGAKHSAPFPSMIVVFRAVS